MSSSLTKTELLHRVVKLQFKPEAMPEVLPILAAGAIRVRQLDGCMHMHMMRSHEQTGLVMTYSWWTESSALEAYRSSPKFRAMWTTLKLHFSAKPEAWSLYLADGILPSAPSQL